MSDPYTRFPPGHCYSTLPLLEEIRANEEVLFGVSEKLGIDLDLEGQFRLLSVLGEIYPSCPYVIESVGDRVARDHLRYRHPNGQFALGDAILLHCMLRHLRPRRFIEVGSGWTSCVMLDTRELFPELPLDCVFIEPYTDRLRSAIFDRDLQHCEILETQVQKVPPTFFETLDENDILFIDSSHVAKIGSDVNYLFFEVLPRLRPGVVVHLHDVHSEFQYRRDLIENGCFWNEAYLLRAFLMFNTSFQINFFSSLLSRVAGDVLSRKMPRVRDSGSSIWLRRSS